MPDNDLPADYAGENKGPLILAVVYTLTLTSLLFVATRLFVRAHKLGRLPLDDYIMVVSQAFGLVFIAFVTAAVQSGAGRHAVELSPSQVEEAVKLITLAFPFGIFAFAVPKFAVVALLSQLLSPARYHRIALWTATTLCLLSLLSCVILTYAQCDPPTPPWMPDVVNAKCMDPSISLYVAIGAGMFSALIDLYLAVYPGVVLWRLRMKRKRKFALSVALGLGVCAGAVGIYKCTRLPGFAQRNDFTYGTDDLVIWTSIESNCVIMAACIPTLAPLLDIFFGRNPLARHHRSPTEFINKYIRRSRIRGGETARVNAHSLGAEVPGSLRAVDQSAESQEWILLSESHGKPGHGSPAVDHGFNDTSTKIKAPSPIADVHLRPS